MALINCPDCGKKMSQMASACPNCGGPNQDTTYKVWKNICDENQKTEEQKKTFLGRVANDLGIKPWKH